MTDLHQRAVCMWLVGHSREDIAEYLERSPEWVVKVLKSAGAEARFRELARIWVASIMQIKTREERKV